MVPRCNAPRRCAKQTLDGGAQDSGRQRHGGNRRVVRAGFHEPHEHADDVPDAQTLRGPQRAPRAERASPSCKRCRPRRRRFQDAFILVIPPPPVQGIGNSGGFKLQVEDRRAAGVRGAAATTSNLMAAGMKAGGSDGIFHLVPHAGAAGLPRTSTATRPRRLTCPSSPYFQTLAGLPRVGLRQRFQLPGPHYQVNLQADAPFRVRPDQIGRNLYARNGTGGMVPLGTLLDVQEINAPDKIMHYNIYPSAEINGNTRARGQLRRRDQEDGDDIAAKRSPTSSATSGRSLPCSRKLAGNSTLFIFPLCVLFVFLALSAQYESWSLPLVIILIVPMCSAVGVDGGVHPRVSTTTSSRRSLSWCWWDWRAKTRF